MTLATPLRLACDCVPALRDFLVLCPECGSEYIYRCECGCGLETLIERDPANLWAVIIELNDGHHWTREQIADWLETLDCDLTVRSQT